MRRVVAIINPRAGAGRCHRRWQTVLSQLSKKALEASGSSLDQHFTTAPLDAQEIAKRAWSEGVRDFLAVGGDGTAFEVANGIFATPAGTAHQRSRLAVLPFGTGNSLVEHFGKGVQDVVASVLNGRTEPFDVLQVRHRRFRAQSEELVALSTITLGIPTRVAQTVNRYLKPLRSAAYHVGALLETVRLANVEVDFEIEIGGSKETIRQLTPLFALQNTSTFGKGMRIAPGAKTSDGLGDLVITDPILRLELLRTLPKVYSGKHIDHPAVHLRRFERIRFAKPTEQLLMIDGEIRTLRLESVTVVPAALDLYI